MAANVMTAKSEVLDVRSFPEELSPDELEVVSGGWSISFFGHKVTGSDVASAAKWVWNKL